MSDQPHYPRSAQIEAYGAGGFRFAGMSHRGSILALPNGIWAWPPRAPAEIDASSFARVFAEKSAIDLLLIGTGRDPALLAEPVRRKIRDAGLSFDALTTHAAASTYNVLFAEGRRVAAALLAVE